MAVATKKKSWRAVLAGMNEAQREALMNFKGSHQGAPAGHLSATLADELRSLGVMGTIGGLTRLGANVRAALVTAELNRLGL